jgi:Domain of unknown function (DUF927)
MALRPFYFYTPLYNMLKQFYEKALPEQGVHCVSTLRSGKIDNTFFESLEDLLGCLSDYSNRPDTPDVFVAMGGFNGYSRRTDNCIALRSLFIDLDVGDTKSYKTQDEALEDLQKLLDEAKLPDPVVIDSGGGIHAYWVMDQDIPVEEWKPYAVAFKALCLNHVRIDPVVTADAARIMRCPDTYNHKFTPPRSTGFMVDDIPVHSWEAMKLLIGTPELPAREILSQVNKGLDEDTKALLKLDNFPKLFDVLAEKSIDGVGCAQIAYILLNSKNLEEPLWYAGLSIAKFCDDGATAIHKMSEDYDGYDYDRTEEKASRFPAPRTCEWFTSNYSERCTDCQHKGKIGSPISLAREFAVAKTSDTAQSVREDEGAQKIPDFPDYLNPYIRGRNGGIYYQPPPKVDKKGNKTDFELELILPYDFYPIRRMVSKHDGECLLMKLVLPKDPSREVLIPMKHVYSLESFKSIMASSGVFPTFNNLMLLMSYVIKWGQFMQMSDKAEIMRMQMGWTENIMENNWSQRSFVIGNREIKIDATEEEAPASPFVRGISRFLIPQGSYEKWREAADYLNGPGFEIHAFTLLCALASPFMVYTSTSGVTICLLGKSGSAKTGAMYAGLSAWGNPKELSVFDATDNGMTGRLLGLHNLPFGIDEISNKDPKILSQLVHKISHGKAKIRMQASVNAEREHEMSASLISIMTTNQSAYSKFEEIKANPDGEAARMIEFLVRKPEVLEVEGGSSLGRKIFDTFNFNYGHVGPMVIKEALRRGDNYIRDTLDKWLRRFDKDFGEDVSYRFYQNLVGVACTIGEMSVEANIISLNVNSIYEFIVRDMIAIREKVLKLNQSDYGTLLSDYINKNLGSILVLRDGKVVMEPRTQIVARLTTDDGLLQVSKTDFKRYLNERQVSSREFESEMRAHGLLIDIKKGRLTTGWKNAIQVEPTNLYCFKSTLPDEIFDAN